MTRGWRGRGSVRDVARAVGAGRPHRPGGIARGGIARSPVPALKIGRRAADMPTRMRRPSRPPAAHPHPQLGQRPPLCRATRSRAGFSMIELLIVIILVGTVAMFVAPRYAAVRASAALRSARQDVVSVLEASRAAALQRGRPADFIVRVAQQQLVASIDTAPGTGAPRMVILTPERLDSAYGVRISLRNAADSVITWDGRGLAWPRRSAAMARYILTQGTRTDSVCVSMMGMIMPRGCSL